MQNGDKSARTKLIEHNARLVFYNIRKFSNNLCEQDDLISCGYLGLIKAVDTFDLSRQNEFSSYATKCIENEMLMYFRKLKKSLTDISIEEPINNSDDATEFTLEDNLSDDVDILTDYTESETYNRILEIINEWPDNIEKEIIVLYFWNQLSQLEIANKLSLSRSCITKKIIKILKEIGYKLKEEGIIDIDTINPSVMKGRCKTIKHVQQIKTIYEILKKYGSKEEIDEVINTELTDYEKELIYLRYGRDLEHPNPIRALTRQEHYQFYSILIPKIKNLLKKLHTPIDSKEKSLRLKKS